MQAALKRHDFGQVFKLARQWGGISFLKIADACDIKPERVGKLARGDGAITTYEKIAYIADALGIPGHMIGMAPRPWEQASTPTSASRPELISPLATVALGIAGVLETDDLGTVDLEGDEVQRRRFLAASIGIATSAAMTPGATAGRRIGQRQVQHLQRRTTRLRSLDDVLGGADTRHIYRAELGTTMNLLRNASYTETTGRQLLSLVAEQAQQAGWAAFDAGRQTEASALYQKAFQAATEARDAALAGNSLAFLAYQQVSTGTSGVATAAASCETASADAPPTVRALLFERRAWAHAKAGQAKETEQALGQAEEALTGNGSDRPGPDWSSWVDTRELQIMKGRCWTELHRPLRAVPALESALADFTDAHARDKSLYLTWLAHAYLDAGEVEQSATVITKAMDLSTGVGSVRPQQRANEFLLRLQPHRTIAPVAELLDRAAM
ncbi:XRE family transcriptional regulator [Streptomyces sp. V1I1]|uniref:XRE family transcriptional regulator n=1 Tax=Streptomyces sp. V1I1 TaxID=3042272 RepID=UPI002784EFB3|nr:XRE family transcriptional regulator [Streptomyces sp. V1I1]MDQ0941782.1 tetratricopeptide (TPR) repeat protein/transcriptional regulator with XRE-family HTH domain [Streptomyces sp. V1I1]